MTKVNMAATTNHPDSPKKYDNMRCKFKTYSEEDDSGWPRKRSPAARIHKDITIKIRGILLKLAKYTIFPIIGGSISGKYNAMVSPMNPMAMMWIARS